MGNIGTKDLLHMINKKLISNCPITHDDLMAANDIFGTRIKLLKVKTVLKLGEHVRLEIKRIPAGILDRYKNVTLTADIMFVNNIILFITISRHMQSGTTEVITYAKTSTLIYSAVNVSRVYKKRGFHISTLPVDGNFDTSHI